MAKRALRCQEGAIHREGRRIARRAPSGWYGAELLGWHRSVSEIKRTRSGQEITELLGGRREARMGFVVGRLASGHEDASNE